MSLSESWVFCQKNLNISIAGKRERGGGGELGAAAVRLRKDTRFTFEGKIAIRDALRIKLDLTITGKLWQSSTSNLYQNSKQ